MIRLRNHPYDIGSGLGVTPIQSPTTLWCRSGGVISKTNWNLHIYGFDLSTLVYKAFKITNRRWLPMQPRYSTLQCDVIVIKSQ